MKKKWKIILISYGLLLVIAFIAIIPGVNLFFFSRHGGPGILLILLSLPWLLFYLFKNIRRKDFISSRKYYSFIGFCLLGYITISYPIAILITNCQIYLGSNTKALDNWILLNFPFLLILKLLI